MIATISNRLIKTLTVEAKQYDVRDTEIKGCLTTIIIPYY